MADQIIFPLTVRIMVETLLGLQFCPQGPHTLPSSLMVCTVSWAVMGSGTQLPPGLTTEHVTEKVRTLGLNHCFS